MANKMQIFGAGLRDIGANLRGQQGQQLNLLAQQQATQQKLEQKAKTDLQMFIAKNNMMEVDPQAFKSTSPEARQQLGISAQAPTQIGGKSYVRRTPQKERMDLQSKQLSIEGKKLLNTKRRKQLEEMPQNIQQTLTVGLGAIAKGEAKPEQFYWELMSNPQARKYQKRIKDILNLSKTSLEASDSLLDLLRGE